MFLLLIRKELYEHLLSLRFAMACAICLAVMLSSTFMLAKDFEEALADYHTSVVLHSGEIDQQDLVWTGIRIDKPLNPLQIFVRGVEEDFSATAKVTAYSEPQFEVDYEVNPVISLYPTIDLLYFVGVVMSLLAIAFSYDAVSGEKELGTLRLLMSYSVPRDTVVLAKWIGGYLALIAPLLLSFLSGLVVILLFPTIELTAAHGTALALIMVGSLLYVAAIHSLGIFVSARTHLSSTSITVLLTVWVLLVFIVPNVAPYVAAQVHWVRDFVLVEKEKRGMDIAQEEGFDRDWAQWMAKNPDSPQNIRSANYQKIRRVQYLRGSRLDDKTNGDFLKEIDVQIRFAQHLSRLSVLSSFAYLTSDLAGVGISDRNRFMELLPAYRRSITKFGLDGRIQALENDAWDRYTAEGYPRFIYSEARIADRLERVFPDLLLLVVWNVVFFMAAYLSFLRYDMT